MTFVLAHSFLLGQPFRKMTETTDWYINYTTMSGSFIKHIFKQKDTLINGYTYSKYVGNNHHYIRDTILSYTPDNYNGNQQVIENINDTDYVLYSFCYDTPLSCCSLVAPQGTYPRWLSFEKRDTSYLENSDSLSKFIYFHKPYGEACEEFSNDYVIVGEGIGSLKDPFRIIDLSAFEIINDVICAYKGNKLLYWNSLFQCPFDSSASLNESNFIPNQNLIITNDKFQDRFNIQVPLSLKHNLYSRNFQIKITNTIGQCFYLNNRTFELTADNIYIKSNGFEVGLYFIQIYSDNNIFIGKILKN